MAVLGPNDGAVKLLAPDGFTQQSTIDEAGSASAGMYSSVAGQPINEFKGKAPRYSSTGSGQRSALGRDDRPVRDLRRPGRQVMLDAIAASDGSRSDVISKLFASNVQNGLLGSFTFNEDGDPVASSAAAAGVNAPATVAITIYKAAAKFEPDDHDRSEADDGQRRARQVARES